MADLRQILAQGRKRLGLLLGAGGPASICVNPTTGEAAADGQPLIPVVTELTRQVLTSLNRSTAEIVQKLVEDIGGTPKVEEILSRARILSDALGVNRVHGLDGAGYRSIANEICSTIGSIVNRSLPPGSNSFTELAGWIGGTARDHPFEVFTPNYDLLFEEACERARIPFFDGFSGSKEPFFDPVTIAAADLPSRWIRLWKIHGSLGWSRNADGEIIRSGGTGATECIYPTHLKFDQTQKLPYSALIERLRKFLLEPDTLLLTSGFSFSDLHLASVIEETLSANRAAAVVAFQFRPLESESPAVGLGRRRANLSVYARDGAVINCIAAPWEPGDLPQPAWQPIRNTFWGTMKGTSSPCFLLGDFSAFARYLALIRAEQRTAEPPEDDGKAKK